MNTLRSTRTDGPPPAISLEREANNLASLALTDSLKSLAKTVVAQWRHRDRFAGVESLGIGPIRQALFYGPPGNGKTVACQWLASEIGVPLYRVRSEMLVESYIGRTAQNVSHVLEWLSNKPAAIVLFDEIESLFPSRTFGSDGEGSKERSGAMTVFWQYLDRWRGPQLFCLATNLLERLDPALRSRVELQLEFGPPTPDQAANVLAYWAERLHDYDSARWAAEIAALPQPESFRQLWQRIAHAVREAITREG